MPRTQLAIVSSLLCGDRSGLRLTSRGRERAWWLLIVPIAAAMVVAGISRIGGAPASVQFGCVAVGTGLGLLVVELRARRAQDDKTTAVVKENVADGSERLRRMRDVRVEDTRVHSAIKDVDVAYVERDVQPDVGGRNTAAGVSRLNLDLKK